MNNEKLIEVVRQYKLLYDLNDKKYCDNQKKDETWIEVGRKLNMDGRECKKSWALLRDAFRRIVKKRKNGRVSEKKWRYEDEMAFLLPYLKLRRKTSLLTSSHDAEDEAEDVSLIDEVQPYINQPFISTSPPPKRQKLDEHAEETTSTLLMKYIIDSRKNTPSDDIEQFFAGITTTVRSFPIRERAIAKAKIFEIVSNMEIDILNSTPIAHDPLNVVMHKKERKNEFEQTEYE
ncbi:unnamed protein product [Leptidea sinapis]|uniref:MADF domain-containing protein n=1 Tax=Leptidea sinapis TaxID=189913 RepID=A0A5E4QE72_9NEOP|nr:unnamed protein product [Leptidea sinapis]